jgi:hypothetical protein
VCRFVSSSLAASDEVQQEDTALCQHVQDGLASPAYDVGRYVSAIHAVNRASLIETVTVADPPDARVATTSARALPMHTYLAPVS